MSHEIKLPEIAENVESATVIEVMVSKGDSVEKDQPLIEIETEKAAAEVPSDIAGTIEDVFVNDGDEIKVGQKIASIKEEGGEARKEKTEKKEAEKEPEKEEKAQEEKPKEKPEAKEGEKEKPKREKKPEKEEKEPEEEEEIKPVPASPAVRRFAREIGVDIHSVRGSGPGGRISMDDVKETAKERTASGGGGAGITLPDFSQYGSIERKPMGRVKEITAENTAASQRNIPQVTHFDEADVTELESFRKRYGDTVKKAGGKLTVTAIIVKIMAEAMKVFPSFNASLDMAKREIIYKNYINIGVAVDTSRGLLVPVIRDADAKSLTRLAVELSELAEKARNKKITPDEMKGGNFTVSNLGGIGGSGFTPVIFPPQTAILAVSRAKMSPVFKDGQFVPRLILPLGVTYDHRIIDGAEGARFLRWACEALENPLSMYLEGGR